MQLKEGHFATISLSDYRKQLDVFVRSVDKSNGKVVLLIVDSDHFHGMELVTQDKKIDVVHGAQVLAPVDLREWSLSSLNSFLQHEKKILDLECNQIRRALRQENKRGYTPIYYELAGDWLRYRTCMEEFDGWRLKDSPNREKASTVLGKRAELFKRRQLLLDKKLGRKTKRKLKNKLKMRNDFDSNSPRVTRASYNMGFKGKAQIHFRPAFRKVKLKNVPKGKHKTKLHLVANNRYDKKPTNWPETYRGILLGTPEECFALAGHISPESGLPYTEWSPSKVKCTHGTRKNCRCREAAQKRYELWAGTDGGVVRWRSVNRQFFARVRVELEENESEGEIKPPDWPEIYLTRTWTKEEADALAGTWNSKGENYREWFADNFYRVFEAGHKGACYCKPCAKKRYSDWARE